MSAENYNIKHVVSKSHTFSVTSDEADEIDHPALFDKLT